MKGFYQGIGVLTLLFMLITPLKLCSQDYDGVLEKNVYIKLKYDACFQGSHCPRYEITVLGNGIVIYEGVSDVPKIGVIQKQINKQKVADLLTKILELRYFKRKDESTNCDSKVELIDGGNYSNEGSSICITSSHGPFTDMNVQFGPLKRKVNLDHYFSDDYLTIKNEILKTAEFQNLIDNNGT